MYVGIACSMVPRESRNDCADGRTQTETFVLTWEKGNPPRDMGLPEDKRRPAVTFKMDKGFDMEDVKTIRYKSQDG